MKNKEVNRFLYIVSICSPIIYLLLNRIYIMLQAFYSPNFESPLYMFFLIILTPIVVSILFFYKIVNQKKMSTGINKTINILVTVFLIAGITSFYLPYGIIYIVSNDPMLTFVFCLQLCSLAYDLFYNRS